MLDFTRGVLRRCALHGDERSEEHTSELQSRLHLVCRLLLEKKKKYNNEVITDRASSACCNTFANGRIDGRHPWQLGLASYARQSTSQRYTRSGLQHSRCLPD